MRIISGSLLAVALSFGSFLLGSASAQAAIACDEDGDCWHTHEVYTYPPAAGVVVHEDNWHWEGDKYHWREHEGRGYWHGGAWVGF